MKHEVLLDRLKAKFATKIVRGIADDDCWKWGGLKDAEGYGLIYAFGNNRRAHRISYQLVNGEIPLGIIICHSCDNPECLTQNTCLLAQLWTTCKTK